MERLTETVKVKLLDGNEAEIKLYKLASMRETKEITKVLFGDTKVSQKNDDIEISPENYFNAVLKLAEIYWADKNYKIDDVVDESLMEVIEPKLDSFLKGTRKGTNLGNN